ncbi:hypothetical protein BDR07DRAFT_1383965 [Suillus spraguei]|nr:hypothetical protein BDR07DRAFT_1383965 [Suillus spraguei]
MSKISHHCNRWVVVVIGVDSPEGSAPELVPEARQRPLVRTGSALLQLVHWLKDAPEHVAQSGWQETQDPEELNVLEGQELTHCPFEASKLFDIDRMRAGMVSF